jgi:peptidoglycan/LPS O-acetylase OafA/YrhL
MNPTVTLGDQAINDLALLAAIIALSAVLVVAALWAAASLRVDRALELASRNLGPTPKRVIACVMTAGSLALLLLPLPSWVMLSPWFAGVAACWVLASLVALAAAGRDRPAATTQQVESAPPLSKAA